MKTTITALAALGALILAHAPAQATDLALGEARYNENCVNCHGRAGRGMASFPSISGRDYSYIADRLTTYRAREMVGPNSAIMMSLAEELTDDEIANLATYIAESF
ncbi:MAG: c-type cytochrome [Pseudomonadota bacterium]